MTIEKGRPWGRSGALPADGVVVRTDAEARAVIEEARRAGVEPPAIGLLGGDLARTVGARGDEDRLRSADATVLPMDLGSVLVDGRLHWFVAHLVARRSWWHGRIVAAMNAQWIGSWDVAPRSHPNDGLLDVVDADLGLDDRLKARRRPPTGTHVPHPDIRVSRVAAVQVDLRRATSQPAPRRSDNGSAGGGTRGAGDADTAFPDPHADAIGRQDLRHLHVGAFRKQRVMFMSRPEILQRYRVGILDEEGAMRIAHAGGRGAALDGQYRGVHLM